MNKEAVVESWGEPEAREVAGESMYGKRKMGLHRLRA